MLLNVIQAFLVSLCFFELTFLKSNSIKFRFSLTLRHTNYQTIKFFYRILSFKRPGRLYIFLLILGWASIGEGSLKESGRLLEKIR